MECNGKNNGGGGGCTRDVGLAAQCVDRIGCTVMYTSPTIRLEFTARAKVWKIRDRLFLNT
jgi:hypothetical protein